MGHAFANEEDPLGNYDAAATQQAWARTIDFLRTNLG
jgi:dienelactone hydrolase